MRLSSIVLAYMYFVPGFAQRNSSRESPYTPADNGDFADHMGLRDICQID